MQKNYFYIALTVLLLSSFGAKAQDSKVQARNQETSIEGLNFYPNPVSNGKIYIISKLSLDKEITIFDVLGKKVLQTILNSSRLIFYSYLLSLIFYRNYSAVLKKIKSLRLRFAYLRKRGGSGHKTLF